jgi:hypothetical protein
MGWSEGSRRSRVGAWRSRTSAWRRRVGEGGAGWGLAEPDGAPGRSRVGDGGIDGRRSPEGPQAS